jgi:flagellar hook-associated protein 2
MAGTVSVEGLISGLNTSDIIDKLMAAERRPIELIQSRQTRANSQLAALRALSARLLAFKTSAKALASPIAFGAKSVSVSDETLLTASASSSVAPGTYALTVNALARAHQIASQGFADTNAATVGTGTIEIQAGDGKTSTVTVDATNNTLAGLRAAINAAGAGVTASIVNDGSDAVPFRLILTSRSAGTANEISIATDLTGGEAPEFAANSISDAVPDEGNTYSGTAASSGAYTGTSSKSYLIEIVHGGALAEATYRVSENGGQTWGSTLALAAGTIHVYDDAHGSDLGVDATFTDETFAAGDRFTIDAFVPTLQAPSDAELVIGSGDGKITVKSSSNTVTNVLPGLTLNLKKADPDEMVEITVANDTAAIRQKIQSFVDQYNGIANFIREQTRYNPETGQAGILLGDSAAMKIQQDLRNAVLRTVPGLPAPFNGLYAIGISVSATGQLSIDSTELNEALQDHLDEVARLFQASGTSTHAKISFVAVTDATASSSAGYSVQVTQAATRGQLAGAAIADPALGGLTIDETNDKLVLQINGVSTSVLSLAHKTYQSGAELAREIAAAIQDSENAVIGTEVVFVDEGATGHFELRTDGYGSGYTVELGQNPSNSAATVLGLADGASTEGQDVAGTIDGFAAEGSGRILKATNTNSRAEGLRLEVTLEPGEIGDGVDAVVTVLKGVAKLSDDLLDYLTDTTAGYVKTREDRFTDQLESFSAQIERQEARLEKRRQQLVERFTRMEQALSSLQSQSSLLTSQFAALASLRASQTSG